MESRCNIEIIVTKITPPCVLYTLLQSEYTGENPDVTVKRHLQSVGIFDLSVCLIHSTSWRYEEPGSIFLTYLVVIPANSTYDLINKVDVTNERLAEAESISNPRPAFITTNNVIKHAFRHLAYLLKHDYKNQYKPLFSDHQITYINKNYDEISEKLSV